MKIDLHCHSYYSDGISSPEKLVKEVKKKNLDGLALCDHETSAGWKEAKRAAKELGLFFIPGEEITTKQGDILALFILKEIAGKNKEAAEVIKEIKSQNGLVVIPHPFNRFRMFKNLEKYLDVIDGIEVLNSRWPFVAQDNEALAFAKKHNLTMTGGSDAHYHREVGFAYTVAPEANNLDELKRAIFEKKTQAEGKKAPLRYLSLRPLTFGGLRGLYLRNFAEAI